MNPICRISCQTREYLSSDSPSEAELYTHEVHGSRFSVGEFPSNRMLYQNMGPGARLLKLRRSHHEGEFLLQIPEKTYALFHPLNAKVILTDGNKCRFRMTESYQFCLLAAGTYSVLGHGHTNTMLEADLIKFGRRDVLYWIRHGYLANVHQSNSAAFDPVWLGWDFMHSMENTRPHTLLVDFLYANSNFFQHKGLYAFLLNGPLAGVKVPGKIQSIDPFTMDYQSLFVRHYVKSRRGKGLSCKDGISNLLESIRQRNLAELRESRSTL